MKTFVGFGFVGGILFSFITHLIHLIGTIPCLIRCEIEVFWVLFGSVAADNGIGPKAL